VFLRNDSELLAMVSNPQFGWISQIASELQPKPKRPPRPVPKKPAGPPSDAPHLVKAAKPQTVASHPAARSGSKDPVTLALADDRANIDRPQKKKNDSEKKEREKKDVVKKDVAKADAPKPVARKPEVLTPEQKARRIAELTARIRKLQDDGDARQVKLLTAQLADLRRLPTRAHAAAPPIGALKPSQLPRAKKQELVSRLYLRTLSRYPQEQEFDRALAYLDKSDNLYNGLRDLVWAVVNTEEFIVNH
jgi:hypothetical protein